MSLERIFSEVASCNRCPLYKTSNHGVAGEGPVNSKIMLIGQAPGKREDETGRAFVGRAGKYLNSILLKYEIKREELYITSIVKHMPPRNRMPKTNEVEACLPYLERQLSIINPKIIVLMGNLAKKNAPRINAKYFFVPHPAAAMRFPKIGIKFEEGIKELSEKVHLF